MQYTAYSVSVENNSNIITGAVGTKFLSKVKAGNSFKVKGDLVVYTISSVVSDEEFRLSAPFMGTTAAGVQYQITTDFTANFGFSEVNAGDQDWATHLTQGMIRKVDATLALVSTGKVWKGTWNASTNVPAIPVAAVGNAGWAYEVAVPGSTSVGGVITWLVRDMLVSNGVSWFRVPTSDIVAADAALSATASADTATDKAGEANTSAIAAAASADEAAGLVVQALDGAVVGPAAAINDDIAVFDGTTGKLVKDGGVRLADLATAGHNHSLNDLVEKSYNSLTDKPTIPTEYAHPTGDGNLHVPANSTTNSGKVLTASATAGTYTWETSVGGLTAEAKTVAFTAVKDKRYICDTTTAAFTCTLPVAPAVGDYIEFQDAGSTWSTNALTLSKGTLKINGAAEDFVCNVDDIQVSLTYVSAAFGWHVTVAASTLEAAPHAIGSHTDWPIAVTMTEVGYLDGVTSGIQAQLNTIPSITGLAAITSTITDGDTTHAPDGNSVFDALASKQATLVPDAQLSRQMLVDCGHTFLDKGDSSTTPQTLDFTTGSHQKITTTGAFTLSTSNWPPTGNLGEMLLELVNGASATITWPTISWVLDTGAFTTTFSANGVTLQSSGTDFVCLWSRDAGTTIHGKVIR